MDSTIEGYILVVDDVPNIKDFLEVTLTFKGFPVRTARNGHEALEVIRDARPALIVTDIFMPQLDGFGLVQLVRSDSETRHIPIIMLSATYNSDEDRNFGLRLGATRFLKKPIDMDEFLGTVTELMTPGANRDSKSMGERDFYIGYKNRLENKLKQKNQQIRQANLVLETIGGEQKASLEAILQADMLHRETIRKELAGISGILENLDGVDLA